MNMFHGETYFHIFLIVLNGLVLHGFWRLSQSGPHKEAAMIMMDIPAFCIMFSVFCIYMIQKNKENKDAR